jgi:hypothetical protein
MNIKGKSTVKQWMWKKLELVMFAENIGVFVVTPYRILIHTFGINFLAPTSG